MDKKYYDPLCLPTETSHQVDFKLYNNTHLLVAITNIGKVLEAYGARSEEGERYHRSVYEMLLELEDQVREQFFGIHKLQDLQVVEDHTEYLAFQYKGCYQMSSRDYAVFYEFIDPNTKSDNE